MHLFHRLVHSRGATHLVGAKVRIAEHGYHGLFVEELHGLLAQFGNIGEHLGIGMTIDERVGHIIDAFLGVQNVHRGKGVVTIFDANHLFGHFNRVAVFGVEAGNEGVGITVFN